MEKIDDFIFGLCNLKILDDFGNGMLELFEIFKLYNLKIELLVFFVC